MEILQPDMKRLCFILFAAFYLTACNSNDNGNIKKDRDEVTSDKDETGNDIKKGKNKKGSYTWTSKDQDDFFNDCKNIADREVNTDISNKFCTCMVSEAQRHYPSYAQMNKETTEENDRKIFKDCMDRYLPD